MNLEQFIGFYAGGGKAVKTSKTPKQNKVADFFSANSLYDYINRGSNRVSLKPKSKTSKTSKQPKTDLLGPFFKDHAVPNPKLETSKTPKQNQPATVSKPKVVEYVRREIPEEYKAQPIISRPLVLGQPEVDETYFTEPTGYEMPIVELAKAIAGKKASEITEEDIKLANDIAKIANLIKNQ